MSCGAGCRRSSDPALAWLWCRLAAAALIQPLAWELPYASGAAIKRKTKTKKQTRAKEKKSFKGMYTYLEIVVAT